MKYYRKVFFLQKLENILENKDFWGYILKIFFQYAHWLQECKECQRSKSLIGCFNEIKSESLREWNLFCIATGNVLLSMVTAQNITGNAIFLDGFVNTSKRMVVVTTKTTSKKI